MAPVPLEPRLSYTGIALVALHASSAIYFTLSVARSLAHSYKSLSPAQDVRLRQDRRRKLVPLFSGLALLSLGTAIYSAYTYTQLSYQVWADARGYLPKAQTSILDDVTGNVTTNLTNTGQPNATELAIYRIRWLADTPIYQDAFEIVAEKARRFWWGQQIDLAMVPWSVLLAIEGMRRRIPNLFAFLCLAHLVSLSFAQNLFYVALLLTPTPLPAVDKPTTRWTRVRDTISPPKPQNWSLKPGVFLLSIALSYAGIFYLPYAAATPTFNRVVAAARGLTFAPLILQSLAPVSWGLVHPHPEKADSAFTDLFRLMSFLSLALHGVTTFTGLRYNLPDSHYHRHSKLLPWDIEERSRWERARTASGKLLGSMADHPVVAAVGYDVLVSGLSLGIWAAVRSLRASHILTSAVPLYEDTNNAASGGHISEEKATDKDDDDDDKASTSGSVRRSGRQHKARVPSVSSVTSRDGDDHHHRAAAPAPRRRGRPRKVKHDPEEEPGDETYKPSAEEVRNSAEGDSLPSPEVDWEAAAVAWGLTALGGLGLGSAGVFGGECLAR
ncbi:hypothetical protein KVR01_004296 [Diaporthe batatas]|uniref:uncharacterized protein n=1 Tax=Diaporthe batatas TaxID=748121 RepID=UPI001D059E5C|nr:uncharacterized protein KVR01_004296 [Diaporthe batatas]KAG8165744.1 hypothetical protein KVR01_004296 [Diaporthe batatas]